MNCDISSAILSMVRSDPKATSAEKKIIEDICTGKTANHIRKKLILRKEVLDILGVSPPTLRKYIQNGFLTEIKLSSRKSRFDYEQVVLFAEQGISTCSTLTEKE